MQRVRITFWVLVVVAIVATGTLSRSLTDLNGPEAVALAVAGGFVALTAVLGVVRIVIVVSQRSREPGAVRGSRPASRAAQHASKTRRR